MIVTTIELEVPIEIEILEEDPFVASLLHLFEEAHPLAGGAGKETLMITVGLRKRGRQAHLIGR